MERAGLGLESPSYVQKRLVLGKQQRMMAEHCQANKLVRQPKREKAYGVGSQPRALRVITRNKPRLVRGTYPVTQDQIDDIVKGELSGITFSVSPVYSSRIASYGLTTIGYDREGIRHPSIKIGKQKRPGDSELIDTMVHEELEARIALNVHCRDRYYQLNEASDDERHAYIQKIIDRYVKMKGIK